MSMPPLRRDCDRSDAARILDRLLDQWWERDTPYLTDGDWSQPESTQFVEVEKQDLERLATRPGFDRVGNAPSAPANVKGAASVRILASRDDRSRPRTRRRFRRLNRPRHAAARQRSRLAGEESGSRSIDEGTGETTDTGQSRRTVSLVSVDAPSVVAEA